MSKAASFSKSFSPFRRRHLILTDHGAPDLWGAADPTWRNLEAPLSDQAIESAVLGLRVLGYFLAASPRAFAIDVDDHARKGSGYLLDRLAVVRSKLGARPSIMARSPRGLHCHYFLTWPLPAAILEERLRERFAGVYGLEVRPTMTAGLRIPAESSLLDPATLFPLYKPFERAVEDAERYHPAEILGPAVLPDAIRESLAERKGAFLRFQQWDRIARAEAEVSPILPGVTNDALVTLIPVYRAAGLDAEGAALRFRDILHPIYEGELRDWGRLLQRVRSFYKGDRDTPYTRPKGSRDPDLFSAIIADNVAARVPDMKRACQRRASVRRFVLGVLDWKAYIDAVRSNPASLAAWGYVYPYFAKNTREGFYPLPKSLLRTFGAEFRILPQLLSVGFLEESPYQYVPRAGISKYYRINAGPFLS